MNGSTFSRFWSSRKELVLSWQWKSNAKGGSRWLPRTLTSMQVILICALTAILLLKNAITPDSFSLSFRSASEALDISAKQLLSPSLIQTRNIAQVKEEAFEAIKEKDSDVEQEEKDVDVEQEEKDVDVLDENDSFMQQDEKEDFMEQKDVNGTKPASFRTEVASLTEAEEEQLLQKIWKENGVLEMVKDETMELDPEEQVHDARVEVQKEKGDRVDKKQKTMVESDVKAEEMWMPEWMPSGFKHKHLGPNPRNWNAKRAAWLKKYPHKKLNSDGKPRMLLVSGTSPWACTNSRGDHFLLKTLKNKADYCRQHNIEIFYNLAHLDKEMSTYWAKLPILRKLMLTHPEIEWFFWMDADALFTDMLFEIPIDDYKGYNLVMWGVESELYENKSWLAINDGVMFIRNCQWSLDLIDLWAPMGPEGAVRDKAGKMLSSFLTKRPANFPADDQSALAYLLITRKELRPKVKLVKEYELSGYFAEHVTHFEEYMSKNHPGLGDKRWPFTTHFVGCQICTGYPNPAYKELDCVRQLERAFNFADNQLLQMMGFMHENLDSPRLKRIRREDDEQSLDHRGPNTWVTSSKSYGV
ncbi:hypothetical protein R1sor_007157 [Riccia sorocarpa]|uniref:Uncharacterized protein n=1 Tax=Riccia sorocarpa TaxID=122646 RepID=A0ABD3HTT5_9MARC